MWLPHLPSITFLVTALFVEVVLYMLTYCIVSESNFWNWAFSFNIWCKCLQLSLHFGSVKLWKISCSRFWVASKPTFLPLCDKSFKVTDHILTIESSVFQYLTILLHLCSSNWKSLYLGRILLVLICQKRVSCFIHIPLCIWQE